MNKKELINYLKKEKFSKNIVKAFINVKRENFISKNLIRYAYENKPLLIGNRATISQPYTIAFMLELLFDFKNNLSESSIIINANKNKELTNKKKLKILEIGSGSGYVLDLINEICRQQNKKCKIYGVERIKNLVDKSRKNLQKRKNIKIIYTDGSKGLEKYSKYDKILISASFDKIPIHLLKQLKKDGIIVCVVRNSICVIKKKNQDIEYREYPGFTFVPILKGRD